MIRQKPPEESPEQRARREREELRADNQVTDNLQDLLTSQTRRFRQRFGMVRNQSPSGPMVGQFINQALAAQAGAAAGASGILPFGDGGFSAGLGSFGGGFTGPGFSGRSERSMFSEYLQEA